MSKFYHPPSLRDLIEPFFRLKGVFLLCVLIVWVPITVFSFYQQKISPMFEAHSKILIERKNISQLMSTSVPTSYNLLDSEIEILMSNSVLTKALDNIGQKNKSEDELDEILDGLSVKSLPKTNILEVNLRHKDQELIAPLVNNLAGEYFRRRQTINRDMALAAGKFFEQEKESVSQKLSEVRSRLKEFKASKNLSSIEEQKRVYLRSEEELHARSKEIAIEINVLKNKIEEIDAELKKPLNRIDISPFVDRTPEFISTMETMLLELELERERLLSTLSKKDKKVQLVIEKIQIVTAMLGRKKRELLESKKKGILATTQHLKIESAAVAEQISAYQGKIRDVEENQAIVDDFQKSIQELDEIRSILMRSIYRAHEAGDIEEEGPVSVYILEKAIRPEEPIPSKVPLFSAVAGIVGLCFGIVAVYLLNYFSNAFRNSSDIKVTLEKTLLTIFPFVHLHPPRTNPLLWKHYPEASLACERLDDFLLKQNGGTTAKTIVFVGSNHQEGTTTILSNWVTYLCKKRELSILLIDAHATGHELYDMFGIKPQKSMVDVLKQSEILKGIADLNRHSRMIITTQKNFDQPDSATSAVELDRLIALKPKSFDLVLIDCPPILKSSNALTWCRKGDAVVYVIECHKTRKQTVKYAQSLLEQGGIIPTGIVLNKTRHFIPEFIYQRL
jgi:succinoglycan biosynthesis transport protein ExoP